MYLEPKTRSDICTMLRITVRQLQSIEKMFTQNKDAYDIVIQLRAAQGGIGKLAFLMNDAFLMDINLFLHSPLPLKMQTPENLKHLAVIEVQLPSCSPKQLVKILYTLSRLKNIN